MPAVSVIVPIWNSGRLLDRAVSSVRAQTFSEWELLAVDDGSTDEAATLLERLASTDPRIRVLRHAVNRGQAAARNTGLRQARGELIAYLDHDDEFYADHLARVWEWRDKGEVLVFRYDMLDEREDAA